MSKKTVRTICENLLDVCCSSVRTYVKLTPPRMLGGNAVSTRRSNCRRRLSDTGEHSALSLRCRQTLSSVALALTDVRNSLGRRTNHCGVRTEKFTLAPRRRTSFTVRFPDVTTSLWKLVNSARLTTPPAQVNVTVGVKFVDVASVNTPVVLLSPTCVPPPG
jgi:hypothetical protein